MVKRLLLIGCMLCCTTLLAQELLVPLQTGPIGKSTTKNAPHPLSLPFFDDFAKEQSLPAMERWREGGGVTLTPGRGLLPPTVGVATLDAIGSDGRLYDGAALGRFAADTLCSLPINLDSLEVADSVVMSFYYLPGGGKGDLWRRIGDAPEPEDSLMLDFYRSEDSLWVTVWACGGSDVDSLVALTGRDWQYVTVAITDTAFLNENFAFRFRNYCSVTATSKPGLGGNCDYWHLDYVFVDRNRTTQGAPEFHDVAFVTPAPSMLAEYQVMPARQYRSTDMVDSLSMTITNLFSSSLATQYQYAILNAAGDTIFRYDGGYENAPSFLPDGSYQKASAHASPAVGYAFPESDTPAVYTVVHSVREGVGGDDFPWNDTVRFNQVFDNFYAYDDGTAENGYGLTSTASRIFLAYRFDLNEKDTLSAVDIYFNRTLNGENEQIPFNITVWDNNNGTPGNVLYRDASSRHPEFSGLDAYCRYPLERPVVVNGTVFVGLEQGNNYYINLGFDRDHDVCNRIFYLTGTAWQQSILSGALMMRPCFGAAALEGIAEAQDVVWSVYPNPANGWVRIEGLPEGSLVELFDVMGRRLMSSYSNQIETAELPDGVYIVRCGAMVKKLIVKH